MEKIQKIKIYTDGAFSGNRQSGGWGVYIPDLNFRMVGNENNTTINRMELTAALKALEYINKIFDNIFVEIYSDSMYLVGGMELGWSKEINQDLWKKLDYYKNNTNVKFIHIPGHAGINENEIVDKLAVKASQFEI